MSNAKKGRHTEPELLPPDDPIFKRGLTIYTPPSARSSTPSTKSSPSKRATPSGAGSKAARTTTRRPSKAE